MRVFVLAVVLLIAFAASASAQQQPQNTDTSMAASASVFSKSSIDRAVAAATATAPKPFAAAKPPAAPRRGKNFFKTPWPYIIIAGVTAGVLIAVYSGDSSSTGGPY